MLPAVCQGTLALETREGDDVTPEIAKLNDPVVALTVAGERGFLARIEGDCTVPMAVHLIEQDDGKIWLRGLVASLDGTRIVRAELTTDASEAQAAGVRLAEEILNRGGAEILRSLQGSR
jgi:porphobilinogen deaminase